MRTPRLWTHIHITLGECSSDRQKERTTAWLTRSRACALNVDIDVLGNREAVHSAAGMLPALLIPQMHRIVSLRIRAKYETTLCILCSAVFARTGPTRPHSLKKLELVVSSPAQSVSEWSMDHIVLTRVGITCPVIPNLTLDNLHFPPTWYDASALASLEITQPLQHVPIHIGDILAVVEGSPQLRSLSISARIVESPGVTAPTEVVHLPILESLTVEANNINGIIRSLRFPTLRRLHLVDMDGMTRWTSMALKEVLSTNSPRLPIRSLRIEKLAVIRDEDVAGIVEGMKNVECIELVECPAYKKIWEALFVKTGRVVEERTYGTRVV
ncbi:hypothetical protein BD410DRAFT_781560 [Rickenella mellea]|uniref:F-box domain-containing protein n=1 Tax=Rickenella mellea TaxID=50990 RepID=A0A4Y7QJ72_9AGAM|nr:hypothetical protein BD410DRAFT_781560 [Rickenella mellea]